MSDAVDLAALPLKGAVLDVGEHHDGRVRVTFRNLAAIYFVDEKTPDKERILAALEASKASGDEVALTYSLDGKRLTGLQS